MASDWHLESGAATEARLATSASAGLTEAEAETRLQRIGLNQIPRARRRSLLLLFLRQFSDSIVLVLAVAAVLAGVIGEPQDTAAIGAILLLNAVLGFIQEYRAERAVEALRAIAVPDAQVRRGGETRLRPSTALVPGDLVFLEAGNVVPADLRLIEAKQLRIEEAALTGESLAREKGTEALDAPGVELPERSNMAYRGTSVARGRGAGLVVATGKDTELGRIATLLAEEPETRTPLQRRLARVGQRLALGALAVCALVLLLGLLRGEAPLPMLLTAISLAVAAIPESLPAVVSVALALGARRMARERALIRRLTAVETLGSVTCICVDKTGTLTLNRMRVTHEWSSGTQAAEVEMWRAFGLCHDTHISGDVPLGEATEVGLVQAAQRHGVDPGELARKFPRVAELPFTSERACMSTLHQVGAEIIAYTKGSPERVLAGCTDWLGPDGVVRLNRELVLAEAERMAGLGCRVMAVARRRFPAMPPVTPEAVESDQCFLGLAGLEDPPREEVFGAIAACRRAGIRVIMITGDHPVTARHIATRLGILESDGELLTGSELEVLRPEVLVERIGTISVYARVVPEQKLGIIRALQAGGECVAMTGDGINDAPALRRADIGIGMGKGGTDVAREAAHMVLLDDNFATIVSAVRAGRQIYDNIRRFVRYAVTCNAAEVATLLLAPLMGLPIPLLPIHLLWINLVTDGLPGIALAAEPAERGVMNRPPRPPSESLFAGGLWQHVVWVGFLMAGVTLATQAGYYHRDNDHWRTMTFTVLALSQMGHVLAIRSERESLFRLGLWSNTPLLLAALATVILQLGTIYLPWARAIFKTERLTGIELLACLGLSAIVFFAVEAEKWLIRRGRLYAIPAPT